VEKSLDPALVKNQDFLDWDVSFVQRNVRLRGKKARENSTESQTKGRGNKTQAPFLKT